MRDPFRAHRMHLRGQLFDIAPRRQAAHPKLIGKLRHHLKRVDADGTSAAQYAQIFHANRPPRPWPHTPAIRILF